MSQLQRQRKKDEQERRRRRTTAAVAAAAAAVVALAAVIAWLALRPGVIVPPEPPNVGELDPAVAKQVATSRAAVLAAPREGKTWLELGLVYDVNAMVEPARACLEQAVLLLPRDAKAWFHLGRVRAKQMDSAPALEALARSRELDRTYPATSWRRGFILLEADDAAGARREFEQALAVDPGNIPATAGLARVALANGDGAMAERLLRPLVQARPRDSSLRFLLGSALRLQGRMDEAEVELKAGSSAMTRWHDAWENAALVYQVSTYGQVNQALAASEDGHHDIALAILERLHGREPGTASVVVNLAAEYSALGRPQDALRVLDPFLAKEPEHAMAHASYAEAALAMGNAPVALEHVTRALELDPRLPRLHEFHAAALAQIGLHEESAAAFSRAIEESPDEANLRFGHGAAMYQLGRPEEAAASLREAVRLDPKHGRAWMALGITEMDLRQFAEAETSLRRAAAQDVLSPPALQQALDDLARRRAAAGAQR